MAQPNSPQEWYYSLKPVTRTLLTAAVCTTTTVSLGLLNFYYLPLDWELVLHKFQFWRLITNFAFLGKFSLPFVFQCYILVKYSTMLEDNPFPSGGGTHMGNSADYVMMLVFGGVILCLVDFFMRIGLLGPSLVFMILYVWSRRNPETPISFFGFKFMGFYLPWVMLLFGILIGSNPTFDILGILAGHLYYFVQEVLPNAQGFMGGKRLLYTPSFLNNLMHTAPSHIRPGAPPVPQRAAGPGPARRHADWGRGYVLGREHQD